MGAKSKIEWTDATWNPIRARSRETGKVGWHCSHVTPGCEHCYSETMNRRLGTGLAFKPGHLKDVELFLDEKMLVDPLRWRKPRKVFPCSTTDLFADFVPDRWIDRMFAVMALTPQHTFIVLTKRPERMRDYVSEDYGGREISERLAQFYISDPPVAGRWPLTVERAVEAAHWPIRNLILGVSVENQATADERIPLLLETPAALRLVSYEPALGPVDFRRPLSLMWHASTPFYKSTGELGSTSGGWAPAYNIHDPAQTPIPPHIDWIIVGGESGRGARPMHPDWARDVRDQCAAAGVAFFFKQWGEWLPGQNETCPSHPSGLAHWQDGRWGQRNTANPARNYVMWDDEGILHPGGSLSGDNYFPVAAWASRVGKKAAGGLLDGREHREFPELPV